MATVKFADVADITKYNNHTEVMLPWITTITTKATDELRPKYGKFYGFEVSTPANAEMVALSMVSYR